MGPDTKKPQLASGRPSEATTAKTQAIVEESNAGLEQLMDECNQFMHRIDEDKNRGGGLGIAIDSLEDDEDIGMSDDNDDSDEDEVAVQVTAGMKRQRQDHVQEQVMQVDERSPHVQRQQVAA